MKDGVFLQKREVYIMTEYEKTSNADILIGDFDEEQSFYIQSSLTEDKSLTYGELLDLQSKTARDLWSEFGDVPIDNNDAIETDWYSFKKGTNRFEIWQWFENAFKISIEKDLM